MSEFKGIPILREARPLRSGEPLATTSAELGLSVFQIEAGASSWNGMPLLCATTNVKRLDFPISSAPLSTATDTAELLLDQAAQFAGLGYASRCLAAWWQLAEEGDSDPRPIDQLDRSLAASIDSLVAKRLGMRMTAPSLAERYECSADHVRRHTKRLQAGLRKTGEPWW